MKKFLFLTLLSLTAIAVQAQTDSVRTTAEGGRISGGITASDAWTLQEIVVTGTRNPVDVRHLPMTVTVIDREALTSQHLTSLLPTAMQQVPGLFVTSRGMMGYGVSTGAAGGINLRGLAGGGGQMLVLIDGHPQYQGIFGHPISDSYQTMMAERVEVLRGPASVLYGSNAMGGVINIVTRPQFFEEGCQTQVNVGAGSYGTVQAEAQNSTVWNNLTSTVSVQYNRSDNHRPNMGFEQYGGYLKLSYAINSRWKAEVTGNLTHWNASNPGSVNQLKLENDQWITRGEVSATLSNHYSNTSGALSVYSNFGRHKINDGYNAEGGKPQTDLFRSKDAVSGISWYQTVRLKRTSQLTVGFDYQHIYGRAWYTNRETGEVVTTPQRLMQSSHSHADELAGYADLRHDLMDWLTVDAGLRYDHHSVAGSEWIPQAGVVVRPTKTGEVKAMVSKGFRNATPKEMYLYKSANEELEPERLWNYELSWRHRMNGGFSYGANIFYIKGDNMIQTVTIDGSPKNVNTGKVENWGYEAEARYPLGRNLKVNANYAWLHMKHPVLGAPEQMSYIGLDYRKARWHATLGLQNIRDLWTALDGTKEDFTLLNASVDYTLSSSLMLWLRGENLLAQKYEVNLGYPMPRATFMGGVSLTF